MAVRQHAPVELALTLAVPSHAEAQRLVSTVSQVGSVRGQTLVGQLRRDIIHHARSAQDHALGAGLVEVAKTLAIVDARQLGYSATRYGRLEEAVIVKVRLAFSPPTIRSVLRA